MDRFSVFCVALLNAVFIAQSDAKLLDYTMHFFNHPSPECQSFWFGTGDVQMSTSCPGGCNEPQQFCQTNFASIPFKTQCATTPRECLQGLDGVDPSTGGGSSITTTTATSAPSTGGKTCIIPNRQQLKESRKFTRRCPRSFSQSQVKRMTKYRFYSNKCRRSFVYQCGNAAPPKLPAYFMNSQKECINTCASSGTKTTPKASTGNGGNGVCQKPAQQVSSLSRKKCSSRLRRRRSGYTYKNRSCRLVRWTGCPVSKGTNFFRKRNDCLKQCRSNRG